MSSHSPLALIMAAGFSRRFNADKRLAKLADGQYMIEKTINRIRQAGLDYRVAIKVEDQHLDYIKTLASEQLLLLETSHLGLGHSIAEALQKLDGDVDCCLICLADMPEIKTSTYQSISAAISHSHLNALIPTYQGKTGNPVAIKRYFFETFKQLQGDKGGKKQLLSQPEHCLFSEVDDAGIIFDIDRPEDLKGL